MELVVLQDAITADPANRETDPVSLYLYSKPARKRLDQITRQIVHNTTLAREASGNPVPVCGYSGRKSNR